MPLLRVQKIVKSLPVVPEVADMTINLTTVISMCPNYKPDKMAAAWGTGNPLPVIINYYNLTTHWTKIREQHTVFTTKFSSIANDDALDMTLKVLNKNGTSSKMQVQLTPTEILHETGKIYDLAKEGIYLMKEWTCYILEMSAWKFQHPADEATMKNRGWEPSPEATGSQQQAIFFEKVVRYNYSKEELSVLVDCISMIKSLAFLLKEKEHKLAPILRVYMQTYVQQFVNTDLAPLVKKSDSKGRAILSFLHSIQELVADSPLTAGGSSSRSQMKRAKKGAKNPDQFATRLVGPGSTQLHVLRVMLRSMNDGSGRGHYLKDIDKSTMALLNGFHEHTFFFPYLTVLGSTIGACSNLGGLWYRELYIQMTNCTQFPIEMSLPFLLSESVVGSTENVRVPVLENVVSSLDVYNDAAIFAIQVLQLQHLYDEIEAEVNLVFDQMMFLIGEQMYDHFKNAASSSLLNGTYKDAIEKVKGYKQLTVEVRRALVICGDLWWF
jgi:cytoplasmic FMR1 interacting protein